MNSYVLITMSILLVTGFASSCANEEFGYQDSSDSILLDYGPKGNLQAARDANAFNHDCVKPTDGTPVVVKQSFDSWNKESGKEVPNATGLAADIERKELLGYDGEVASGDSVNIINMQPTEGSKSDETATENTPDSTTPAVGSFNLQERAPGEGQQSTVHCGYRTVNGNRVYEANITTPVTQHSAIFVNKLASDLDADLIIGRGENSSLNGTGRVEIEKGVYNTQYSGLPGFNDDGTKSSIFDASKGNGISVDGFSSTEEFVSDDTKVLADSGAVESGGNRYKIMSPDAPNAKNDYACGNMLGQLLASQRGSVTTAGGGVKFKPLKKDAGIYFIHGPSHNNLAPASQQRQNAERWSSTTDQVVSNYFKSKNRWK